MGSHHEHSWASYQECKREDTYVKLWHKVARFFENNKEKAFTDREVKTILVKEGIFMENDMNAVRPKITNLKKIGMVIEAGWTVDAKTKRKVRLVQWNRNPNDQYLIF